MDREKARANNLDYPTLVDLARSSNIRCLEVRGLDTRRGVRFWKDGSDWIAVDSDLAIHEKIRT